MSKKDKKPVFVVDNDTQYSEFDKRYHKKAKFYSTTKLVGRSTAEDQEIFIKSSSEDIHIITRNCHHFIPQQIQHPTVKIGIVGIASTNVNESIKTFGKLLKQLPKHEDYRNKYISVSSKGFVITDRTTEIN